MKRFVCLVLCLMLLSTSVALADSFTFLTPSTKPTTSPTYPPFTAVTTKDMVLLTGDAYVRTGLGRSFKSLGVAKKDMELVYAGQTGYDERNVAWYKVEFNGGFGWVSSKYAELKQIVVEGIVELYVRATASVNIREGAGINYADIGTLARGEQVKYTGVSQKDTVGNTWYEIDYYGKWKGWVSAIYSELIYATEAGVAETETKVVGSYVEATKGKSNLRSGPGLDYEDLGTLKAGQKALYMGISAVDERGVLWYYVKLDDQLGWISSRYTTLK